MPARKYTPPNNLVPALIELPKSGDRCPLTTLSRTAMDLLVRPQEANDFKPPVKSRMFAQEGSKRARRLVHYPSLLAYLLSLPDGADPKRLLPLVSLKRGLFQLVFNPSCAIRLVFIQTSK
jgi:hypothetical protein